MARCSGSGRTGQAESIAEDRRLPHARCAQGDVGRDLDAQGDWFTEHAGVHPSWFRPYQIEARTAIEHAIAGRKRQVLVAMATGTGKTWTLVNEVYRLLESGVAKRILFLVDRRALAAQAVRAFAAFEPGPSKKFDKLYEVYGQRFQREGVEGEAFDPKVLPKSYLETPHAGHAYVYVCTIQRNPAAPWFVRRFGRL